MNSLVRLFFVEDDVYTTRKDARKHIKQHNDYVRRRREKGEDFYSLMDEDDIKEISVTKEKWEAFQNGIIL